MMLNSNHLEFLESFFAVPHFKVFSKPEWGSQNPEHRNLLRAELTQQTQIHASAGYHSISHCPAVGVLVLSSHPIGVDVEKTARVELKIVARVSSSQELVITPSPASLWCAKEAAFKALRPYQQPSVISDISIEGWQKIDSQIETFHMRNPSDFQAPVKNKGVVIHADEMTYCFFIFCS